MLASANLAPPKRTPWRVAKMPAPARIALCMCIVARLSSNTNGEATPPAALVPLCARRMRQSGNGVPCYRYPGRSLCVAPKCLRGPAPHELRLATPGVAGAHCRANRWGGRGWRGGYARVSRARHEVVARTVAVRIAPLNANNMHGHDHMRVCRNRLEGKAG